MARIAFIQYFWMEKLGLMYISSALKKSGHQTSVCFNNKRMIRDRLIAFKPAVVGFYCVTGMQRWIKDIARFIKTEVNKEILVIVGGPHPTFFPELIEEDGIDIICQGEGEYPMLDLANAIDSGGDITGIKNLWVKLGGKVFKNTMRPLIQDLDELPFPDRGLYEGYKYIFNGPYHHAITSRGCSYDCTFCYNHAFKEMQEKGLRYARRRSIDNVMRELEEHKKRYKAGSIVFLDDNFSLAGKGWLFSFLEEYKRRIAAPFFCLVRANSMDEEFVRRLKESGCYWVEMGVECGDEKYRNGMLNKNLKDSEITNAARLFHKYRLNFNTTNMMGLPHERLEGAIKTIEFNSKIKPEVAWCSLFQPYPKTHLGEYCLRNGLIDKLDGNSLDVHSHTASALRQKDIKEVVNLHKFAHVAVKFPFLLPFIKALIKLPPNRLFIYLNRFTYLIFYWAKFNKMNLKRMCQEAIIALRYYRNV